jgi:hypothetical protein
LWGSAITEKISDCFYKLLGLLVFSRFDGVAFQVFGKSEGGN